ncbi:MAG TPA: biotin--[acetyl-CoA-carboxylase] ligase [Pyrinomonadaceae bacterium]|nr:biotin--[acetyl-CoA-carboxylase] ligase [Pyrinomonadaceae bacterium]
MLPPHIIHFESLPSTNQELAKRAVAGAAEGLCIVAAEQTAGRGRLQRTWISPKNAGLYFSILLRPQFPHESWPLLTLMAAVAVHDALLEACALQTDIKWPNDILANEKKLCGILAETIETTNGRAVAIGIGVNLTRESIRAELEQTATSVEHVLGKTFAANVLLKGLLPALVKHYTALGKADGAESIIREWCARSSYSEGKLVKVSETNEEFAGITRGLERDGALRVETSTGEIRVVRAGDVTSVRPS